MTTNLPRGGPSPSTTGSPVSVARTPGSSQSVQQPTRAASRTGYHKNISDTDSSDASGDKNTVALIRRVLCPESSSYGSNTPRPLQELLPPLTSSNDIDLQLYALIAIIIKEFVYSWYTKITSDHIFVDEVLQLIAHCTRALEQRLRQVDIKQLLLDEIPSLVEAHITAYRMAKQGSNLVCVHSSTRDIYHQLNPHPSLSPPPDNSNSSLNLEQQENERLYRHLLVQGLLAVLLPTEDLGNVCLRTLVEDIFADLILGNEVGGKVCESWFIWTTASKVIELTRRQKQGTTKNGARSDYLGRPDRLERFGLLSTDEELKNRPPNKNQSTLSLWMWKTLYMVYVGYVAARFVIGGLCRTALSPSKASVRERVPSEQFSPDKSSIQTYSRRPVLDYKAFGLVSQWTCLSQRMPWLSGTFSLVHSLVLTGPGKLGESNGVIDRFLRELIDAYILTPALVPTLLLAARTTLFPSNTRPTVPAPATLPGTSSGPAASRLSSEREKSRTGLQQSAAVPSEIGRLSQQQANRPSESEICAIKRQCAIDILSLIPRQIALAFFCGTVGNGVGDGGGGSGGNAKKIDLTGDISPDKNSINATTGGEKKEGGGEEEEATALLETIEDDLLDAFSDAYCNKHLVFAIVEAVLVRLLPELSERGISELMEERGVTL